MAQPCVMYEGAPNWPAFDRFWAIIEKHKVNILYTAPTAIRTFIKWGDEWPKKHDLSQPAPAGHGRRADQSRSVDVVSRSDRRQPLPDRRYLVADRDRRDHDLAGSGRRRDQARLGDAGRCPEFEAEVVTRSGERVPLGSGGFLVIKQPWPSMLRTIYGDPDRYVQQYWSDIPGVYFTGDGAREDEDGILLDHGPRRRRAQRFRTPPQHHGNRIGAGGASLRLPKPPSSDVLTR